MPIDPRLVKWDEEPKGGAIDPKMVKWDAEPTIMDKAAQGAKNVIGGAVRGAGSIGATIVDAVRANLADPALSSVPQDMRPSVTGGLAEAPRGAALRQEMDSGLQALGTDPSSLAFKGGKLAAEVAGTAGAGGAMANGVRALGASRALIGLEPIVNGVARALETGGFRVGELAGTGLGTAARIGTGALTGGVSAGMVNPGDAGRGAMIGGALPGAAQLAGKAGGAIRNAVAPEMAPEVRNLAQRAQEMGINIPADRLVNSRPLNAVAAGLNYVPFSGRAATEDAMVSQLNRKLSNTFGQDSSNVTMALRKADDALGGQFDRFLQANTVRMDRQFLGDLAEVSNQATKELSGDLAGVIKGQVDDIMEKAATGQIDGQAAYNIKKTLDKIGKRNSSEAAYAIDLKQKLMEALNRSVGPEKAASFAGLRQQYGSMLELEKLAKNGAEGEISVARLANMKNIRNPQMQELADIAAQFVKPREGQHGAAQRAFVGAATFGMGGAPGLAAGAAAGRAANMALNSKAAKAMLMRPPGGLLAEPEGLGLLTQGAYRSLPLIRSE